MDEVRARRGRALAALVTPLLLLVPAALPAAAGPSDRLERVDHRQERVEARLEDTRAVGGRLAAHIADLDRVRARMEARVAALDATVAALDHDIEEVEARLVDAQSELAALRERLSDIEGRLAARHELFADRAVDAYKTGSLGAVDTLLSSGTLADVVDRFAYLESALDADATLLEEIGRLEAEVEAKRAEAERRRVRIAADKMDLERRRARLDRVRDERADALAAQRAAIARKESILGRVRSRQGELRRVRRRLAEESARIEAVLAAQAAGYSLPPGGQLAWPAAGPVTSGFGYRDHPILDGVRLHTGIDIGAPYGAPVWAAAAGTVVYVGTMSGYGNVVIVDHGGLATTYNHLSAATVSSGQAVVRGQEIASVGCTGYCTGPHLHFEVRVDGAPVDPLPYLR
ncbi:MAG TPA: peptidoglycan DD-metalloendopeptidase family protein [Actinomycetota bacterium]|nr:peptidoglycan DD-metalloendopeptidase family protein [Actinomycetota bacterium]